MNINALRFEQARDPKGQPTKSMTAINADPDITLRAFMLRYATQTALDSFFDGGYQPDANPDVVIELRLPAQDLKETTE